VLSPDGSTVYIAALKRILFAVDTVTGAERWRYTTRGDIHTRPAVMPNGNILIGSDGHDLTMLSQDGTVLFRRLLPDKIQQPPVINAADTLLVRLGNRDLIELDRLPNQWNGAPDVQPTADDTVWEFVSPVTIDVGVDRLHAGLNGPPITGQGVTVAVVDTGVYFDDEVKTILGTAVQELFVGQADFTGNGQCTDTGGHYQQYSAYCWTDEKTSRDRYGHGSHVAGIIWNQFKDADTGVTLGVAPGARILRWYWNIRRRDRRDSICRRQ
jgi:subtilisin family serine protease